MKYNVINASDDVSLAATKVVNSCIHTDPVPRHLPISFSGGHLNGQFNLIKVYHSVFCVN